MSKLQNFLIPALKSVIVSVCCPWLCLQVVFYRWAMLIKRIDFCNAMWHIDNEILVYKCAPASNCTFTTSHDYSRRCISNIPEDLWSYSIDFLARCVWILQGNVYLATFFSGTSDVTTLHEKKQKEKEDVTTLHRHGWKGNFWSSDNFSAQWQPALWRLSSVASKNSSYPSFICPQAVSFVIWARVWFSPWILFWLGKFPKQWNLKFIFVQLQNSFLTHTFPCSFPSAWWGDISLLSRNALGTEVVKSTFLSTSSK